MHCKSIIAVMAISLATFGAAIPQNGYGHDHMVDPGTTSTTSSSSTSSTSSSSSSKSSSTSSSTSSTSSASKTTSSSSKSSSSSSSSSSSITKCPKTCRPPPVTSTITTTHNLTQTISPTCSTTKCPKKSTITETATTTKLQTKTIIGNRTMTITEQRFITSTPGPVVNLIAYDDKLCGVDLVSKNGDAPNFQEIALRLPSTNNFPGPFPFQVSSECRRTEQVPGSFSWDVVSFGNIPGDCNVNFYQSDSCFSDDNGVTELSLTNGQNACHNLRNVRSVQVNCGF